MSTIHELTVSLISGGVYAPEDYQAARRAAALELAGRCIDRAEYVLGGGDYKDEAARHSAAIWNEVVGFDRDTRKAIAEVLGDFDLLDGYNCPRAFLDGLSRYKWEKIAS